MKAAIQVKDAVAQHTRRTRVTWERHGGKQNRVGNPSVRHRPGEKAKKTKPYLVFLGGFGLGPRPDVSHTSPSRGVNWWFLGGGSDVGLRLVPHFALGPIANIPNPASSGGDSFVVGMSVVDRRFKVRGPKVSDLGVASPSCRVSGSIATTRTPPRDIRRSATP